MLLSKKQRAAITAATLAVMLAAAALIAVPNITYKGQPSGVFWTINDDYDIDGTAILEKDPEKDFVILNFSDVQFEDNWDIGHTEYTYETMRRLIEDVKPDLITVTGDIVWGPKVRRSLRRFIRFLDSYGIPWAPVLGNHDGEGNADRLYEGHLFEDSQYCLFKIGPENVDGVGNYIVNITENGKIVNSLIFMDSGMGLGEGLGYDFIKYDQILWYYWAVNGAKAYNGGGATQSTLFFHIPLPEYEDAYASYEDSGFDSAMGFGSNGEDVSCSYINTGFFEIIEEQDSTKNIIVGHDHINNSSVIYKGVRLTYSVKTGDRCYFAHDKNGGTVLTVDSSGAVNVEHRFISLSGYDKNHDQA